MLETQSAEVAAEAKLMAKEAREEVRELHARWVAFDELCI